MLLVGLEGVKKMGKYGKIGAAMYFGGIALVILSLAMSGCMIAPAPNGQSRVETRAGLPGLLSIEGEIIPGEPAKTEYQIREQFQAGLQKCVATQNQLQNGNVCLRVIEYPKMPLLASMHGFEHCFNEDDQTPKKFNLEGDVSEVEKDDNGPFDHGEESATEATPAPSVVDSEPDPEPSPVIEQAGFGVEYDPEWCKDKNNKHPYCVAQLELKAHKWLLDAVRRGCEYIEGKDNFYKEGGKTHHCSIVASDVLANTIMAPLEY